MMMLYARQIGTAIYPLSMMPPKMRLMPTILDFGARLAHLILRRPP